jgi:outer membrane murein-binding lipoprotein Lpp
VSETTRTLAKKAASAAVEKVMQSAMPQLMARLDSIQTDIRHLDIKVDQLRQDMYDKFEQTRDVVNEVGQRVARVEGRLDELIRAMSQQSNRLDRQSDKMDQWMERVVRVEMGQGLRKRRTGKAA